jgi:hypothetical protein
VNGSKSLRNFFFGSLSATLLLRSGFALSAAPVASFFYDESGNITRQEQDTNGDGKMDRRTYYNRQGQVERVEQDANFDGRPDIFFYYEAGKLQREEIASKNDAQIDLWHFFNAKGELERKGQDTNRSGKPNVWIHYRNGQPIRSDEDPQSLGRWTRVVHYIENRVAKPISGGTIRTAASLNKKKICRALGR